MKQVLRVCAAVSALTLSSLAAATEFYLYDHKKQCGMQVQRMDPYSQAELDEFQACIAAERDAMGRLMNQWGALDTDQKERCLVASAERDAASYVEAEECISQ